MGLGRAPGKVILAGEHFVVHGTPALAVPLASRGVEVEVSRAPGPWEVADDVRPHLLRMLEALGEDPSSLQLRVRSTLPVGAGLGGSAALAVALVRALCPSTAPLSIEVTRARAHELERLAHGRPSGIDDSVAAHGCAVWFTRADGPRPLPEAPTVRLWVGLTAQRTATLEAVARVGERARERPEWFASLAASARRLAGAAMAALLAGDDEALGATLDETHTLLQEVGVSTPQLDALVEAARAAGALGAKLTGGGLGGAAIALAPLGLDLHQVWRRAGAVEVIAP